MYMYLQIKSLATECLERLVYVVGCDLEYRCAASWVALRLQHSSMGDPLLCLIRCCVLFSCELGTICRLLNQVLWPRDTQGIFLGQRARVSCCCCPPRPTKDGSLWF